MTLQMAQKAISMAPAVVLTIVAAAIAVKVTLCAMTNTLRGRCNRCWSHGIRRYNRCRCLRICRCNWSRSVGSCVTVSTCQVTLRQIWTIVQASVAPIGWLGIHTRYGNWRCTWRFARLRNWRSTWRITWFRWEVQVYNVQCGRNGDCAYTFAPRWIPEVVPTAAVDGTWATIAILLSWPNVFEMVNESLLSNRHDSSVSDELLLDRVRGGQTVIIHALLEQLTVDRMNTPEICCVGSTEQGEG